MSVAFDEAGLKAALEQVEGWEAELERWLSQVGRHVARSEMRDMLGSYVRGLLGPVERRTSWQLSAYLGESKPYGIQRLLGRAAWSAEAVCADVQAFVIEGLGDPDGVLVIDETGFPKKGTHSAGVQRQYSGTLGKVDNCQVGVFLAYSSVWGQALLDRALYLPASWTADRTRCRAAGIPDEVGFQTKPVQAQAMLERALAAGIPARWVTGDSVYGQHRGLRRWLEERRCGYVLGINSLEYSGLWRDEVVHTQGASPPDLAPAHWQRLSAGEGSQGPRLFDWAYLPLTQQAVPGYQRGLLLRRSLAATPEVSAFRVFAPEETALATLVRVAGQRWAIECAFQQAKALGLDQYEVRSWVGWYRHVTLVMLALAFLAVLRQQPLKKHLWSWTLTLPWPTLPLATLTSCP